MSGHCEGLVHSNDHSFAFLDKMGQRFFFVRWMPHELSAELKAKRVEVCREMLEVLEQLGPRQKAMLLQGMNAGFTVIIITAANRQQIVRQYLVKFVPQFRRKRRWFRLISLAEDLFPLKHFRKQNDSILHSSLKQFFQVSFDL
jgi:diadenosine tetraphosphate (Ap4A) HIT family hydrolase